MKTKKCRLAAAVLCAGALVFGMGAAQADTIKVGFIGALTGGGAGWGLAATQGMKIAADEVNAQGGLEVNGKRYEIDIVAYDDQYNAAKSVAAYNRLTRQDGAKYVVLMTSTSSLAVKESVESDGVLALTSAFSEKVIDSKSKLMFRLFSTAEDYAPGLVGWLADNTKERRIILLNPNDETGWDQNKITELHFKKQQYEMLGSELYERNLSDFQPLLTKVLSKKPDVIDVGSSAPGTSGLIVRQARDLGYQGLFVKTGGSGPEEIVKAAGVQAAEGMISTLYADPTNSQFQQLAATYEKSKGHSPNAIIVPFYDSAKVLFSAIQKAGSPENTALVAGAFSKALPMASVQGEQLTLGGTYKQQIRTPMYVGKIHDGKPVVMSKLLIPAS